MQRRQFLRNVALLGLSTGTLDACSRVVQQAYQVENFGDIRLLHLTDSHAQLLPVYFREPAVNLGLGDKNGLPPHIVGKQLLNYYGIPENSANAYALTYLDFSAAAEQFGKLGGYAHLATLIKQLRGLYGEDNTLLLDGGDAWQGSATALWTQGRDMVRASNLLGVDVMTGHWEFSYGEQQVQENIAEFNGDFIAQNVLLTDKAQFEQDQDSKQVFKPYVIKHLQRARVAIIGQAFPYTPIANPQHLVPNWQFGIQEQNLQSIVDQIRNHKQADAIILLSHNGMDVDIKLASRVHGIDFILGGHTHDAMPDVVTVTNPGGVTRVASSGSHGKFLGVLDLQFKAGAVTDYRYRLLPVFSSMLKPDQPMQQLITDLRKPYLQQLQQPLAVTESLLYRRDNFYGSFDQIILSALQQMNEADISLSPGFRWGASLLPGQIIKYEDIMNLTAITYPETYSRILSGLELKQILEDVCDNLFNADPYLRQGGDMVRVGGLSYRCAPNAGFGQRIHEMRLSDGSLIVANRHYKVAGWATVNQISSGKPVWELIKDYLIEQQIINIHSRPNFLVS